MKASMKSIVIFALAAALALSIPLVARADVDRAKAVAYSMLDTFETLGYSFRETGRYGGLERGAFFTFSTTLYHGSTYVIIAGGDGAAVDLDLKIYDENGALVASDQDHLPSAVVRVTPAWSGTFYVRVIMADAKAYGNWYCIMGQAAVPKPKPVPIPKPEEKVGYFQTEWIAPGTAEAIEAYFRPYYTIPSSKFVYDKYGRTRYSAGAMIFFNTNSAAIKPESIHLLNEWGRALRRGLSRGVFMVEGHTDSTGTDDVNLRLSEKRAQSVVDYLVKTWGISPVRLIPRGFGKLFPLESNVTASGRATNRRVQFTLIDWLPY